MPSVAVILRSVFLKSVVCIKHVTHERHTSFVVIFLRCLPRVVVNGVRYAWGHRWSGLSYNRRLVDVGRTSILPRASSSSLLPTRALRKELDLSTLLRWYKYPHRPPAHRWEVARTRRLSVQRPARWCLASRLADMDKKTVSNDLPHFWIVLDDLPVSVLPLLDRYVNISPIVSCYPGSRF